MTRTTPFPKFPSLFIIFFIAISTLIIPSNASSSKSNNNNPIVNELLALQSKSKSGVILFTDQSVSKFLTSIKTPRPYWLIVFFDAAQLHDRSDLRLKDILREFSLVASSFIANNPNSSFPSHAKLFFSSIEYRDSSASFTQFGVNALPHIRLVSPHQSNLPDSDQLDHGDVSRFAETLAEFIQSKTNLAVGPIHRLPLFSRNRIALLAIGFAIWFAFFVKKLIAGETVFHDSRVWLLGAVFVYFVSVSGTMHMIIRKAPLYLVDRKNRNNVVIFYKGSSSQLGLEGFSVGFLFTVVGLVLGHMTHGVVKMRNTGRQRLVMILGLLVCFWAVKSVVFLKNWKTGYPVHGFWPSRWSSN